MVELGHGWSLDADGTTYELCRVSRSEKGNEYKNNSKYYSSLSGALNCYYRLILNEAVKTECSSISDVIRCVERCAREMGQLCESKFPSEVVSNVT